MESAGPLPVLDVNRNQSAKPSSSACKRTGAAASRAPSTADKSLPDNNVVPNPDPSQHSQLDDAELLAAEAMALLATQDPENSQTAAATALPATDTFIEVCSHFASVLVLQIAALQNDVC